MKYQLNDPIRILQVVSRMDRAGQETLIMNLYRNIDRSQIQFDFLCSVSGKGDYDEEIQELGGIINHLAPNKYLKKVKHLAIVESVYRYASFFRKHKEYDIVHFHNYHAYSCLVQVLGAKLGGVKNIIIHSHNTNAPHPSLHKISKKILNLFSFNRFACSEDAARWMYGDKKARIVFNGINPDKFMFNPKLRECARKELGLDDATIAILHIGRFNYQKNHIFLLEVFKEFHNSHPDCKLLLVGKGELENQIKTQISTLHLDGSVKLLGIREDIPELFEVGDLFLFPSLFEGLSVVLVEAQASGIPILTVDNLAKETIFSDNVNQLELSRGPKYWADEILKTIKLGRNVSSYKSVSVNGFDIRTIANELAAFYSEL